MDEIIAANISETSRNLGALHKTVLGNSRLLNPSIVLYARRLASRYRLLCAHTSDALIRFEEDASALNQTRLADAVLMFKSDNDLYNHIMVPTLYWANLDNECHKNKLAICNYLEYTFAFELIQSIGIAVGSRFYESQEEPVEPNSLVEMVAGPVISEIIANESLAKDGLNQGLKDILCNRTVGISDKDKRTVQAGKLPDDLAVNFEFMRKILHKIQNTFN